MNIVQTGCRLDNLRKNHVYTVEETTCSRLHSSLCQQTLESLLCSDGLKYGVFKPNSPFPIQFSTENKILAKDFVFKIQASSVSLQIILPVDFHLYLLPPLEQYEALQSSYLLPKKNFQTGQTSDSSQLEGLVNLGHLIPICWHNLKCQNLENRWNSLLKYSRNTSCFECFEWCW